MLEVRLGFCGVEVRQPTGRARPFKLNPVASAPRNAQRAADNNEAERRRRLREDAQRSLSVNLAEGIALSHKLMSFTGAAHRT
jgi:hypothetical protein